MLVVVCKAFLFTAVSSEIFDYCKLYTLMTIDFVLYAEAYTLYCFLGLETGAWLIGLAKYYFFHLIHLIKNQRLCTISCDVN